MYIKREPGQVRTKKPSRGMFSLGCERNEALLTASESTLPKGVKLREKSMSRALMMCWVGILLHNNSECG